jgi:hypothetical protein
MIYYGRKFRKARACMLSFVIAHVPGCGVVIQWELMAPMRVQRSCAIQFERWLISKGRPAAADCMTDCKVRCNLASALVHTCAGQAGFHYLLGESHLDFRLSSDTTGPQSSNDVINGWGDTSWSDEKTMWGYQLWRSIVSGVSSLPRSIDGFAVSVRPGRRTRGCSLELPTND